MLTLRKFRVAAAAILLINNQALALSLVDAVQLTLGNHPEILSAQASEQAAKHYWKQIQGNYFPVVDLSLSESRDLRMPASRTNYIGLHRSEHRLSVSQLLFDGWGTAGQVHTAAAQSVASHYYSKYKENAVALSAVQSYLDVLRYNRLITLSESNLAVHRKALKKVQAMYQGGAGSKADLDLAKSRMSFAETTQTTTERYLNNARAVFNSVVGEAPFGLSKPTPPLRHLPRSLREALSIGEQHHPALSQAIHEYHAARYTIRTAQATYLPRVTFELTNSHSRNVDGTPGYNNAEQAAIVMRYNLLKGGADYSLLRGSEQKASAARHNVDKTGRQILQTITEAWNNLQASKEKLGQTRDRVVQTEKVVEAYRQQFDLGKRSLLNLLDTERELFSAQTDMANSEYDYILDIYALYAATGTIISHI